MGQEGDPRWYYVGNGQLRYKDENGWTDQYEDIDGPPKVVEPEPVEAPEVPAPGRRRAKHVKEVRSGPSPLKRLGSTAAHRSISGLAQARSGLRALVTQGRPDRPAEPEEAAPANPPAQLSPEWMVVLGIGPDDEGPPGSATFTTQGTLTLIPRRGGSGEWRRSGALAAGAEVRVSDASGETLAIGLLGPGAYVPGEGDRSIGSSVFEFTLDDIPAEADSYTVTVGTHSMEFTNAEMRSGPSLSISEPSISEPGSTAAAAS